MLDETRKRRNMFCSNILSIKISTDIKCGLPAKKKRDKNWQF